MTAVYNLAKASPCVLPFHMVTDGAYDLGCGACCLWTVGRIHLGVPISHTLLLALFGGKRDPNPAPAILCPDPHGRDGFKPLSRSWCSKGQNLRVCDHLIPIRGRCHEASRKAALGSQGGQSKARDICEADAQGVAHEAGKEADRR